MGRQGLSIRKTGQEFLHAAWDQHQPARDMQARKENTGLCCLDSLPQNRADPEDCSPTDTHTDINGNVQKFCFSTALSK